MVTAAYATGSFAPIGTYTRTSTPAGGATSFMKILSKMNLVEYTVTTQTGMYSPAGVTQASTTVATNSYAAYSAEYGPCDTPCGMARLGMTK